MTTDPTIPHVFLAGTCGGDQWRKRFEITLTDLKTSFFNPQVDNWEPWMVEQENICLQSSPLVLFPVLNTTLGLGSLAEIGFSILSVVRSIQNGHNRNLIVFIDPTVKDTVTIKDPNNKSKSIPAGQAIIQESIRTRHLVSSKLKTQTHPNIHITSSLDDMHKTMINIIKTPHPSRCVSSG